MFLWLIETDIFQMSQLHTHLTLSTTMTHPRLLNFFLFALTCLFLQSCSLDEQQLKKGWWKYGEGYHLGDVVDFNNGFSINGDTVLQNGQRVGIIIRKTKGLFGDDNEIEITSLDKKKSGIYHQK